MKKLIISLIFLILFILVLIGSSTFLVSLDSSVNQSIPSIQNQVLVSVSKIIDFVFDTWLMLFFSLIITIVLFLKYSRKHSIWFALTMLANATIVYLLKLIIARPRPINSLIQANDFSFPSGHTATAIVFFGLLCYIAYKNKSKLFKLNIILSTITIIIIAFSRILLNIHYISDVLASIFLGLFILFLSISIRKLI